jgi:molybdate transport system substrate-binding protein
LVEAGVDVSVDTNEPDVRSLLSKIEAGELDVGITYVTDVISTDGAVEGLDIPEELNVVAAYPIVALEGAGDADLAEAFIEFVLSSDGQEIIGEFGFSSP